MDTTPLTTGQGHDQSDSFAAQANKKAVEALQLLLNKLPYKKIVKEEVKLNVDSNANINDVNEETIHQYEIPRDRPNATPIPPFKPLKGITSTYTWKLGPFEAQTKQTIGGPSASGEQNKYTYDIPTKTYAVSASPQPPPLQPPAQFINPAQFNVAMGPLSTDPAQFNVANLPLNLYHTMALKHNNDPVVIKSIPAGYHNHNTGPGYVYQPYEITKSVAYDLSNS